MNIAFWRRVLMPGLVVQAVVVGGGYATGRELVEFFLSKGLATAVFGLMVTMLLFSLGGMVSFELARRYRVYDYHRFSRLYLGRFSFLFEAGYLALLLLVLAVVSASAAELIAEATGAPKLLNAVLFMGLVALLLLYGSELIERVGTAWSLSFYVIYGLLIACVLLSQGDRLSIAWQMDDLALGTGIYEGLAYTGYNIVALPILIFLARHFGSRKEALWAGALCGPAVLLPGFGFLFAMATMSPEILEAPLPVTVLLQALDLTWLQLLVQLVIIGALLKTGTGLVHGFNERVAQVYADKARAMPRLLRPGIALVLTVIAVTVADRVGLIDLIGSGYRYSSLFFLLVFLVPVLTRGAWMALAPRPADEQPASG